MKQSLVQLVEQVRGGGPQAVRAAGRLMTMFEDQPHRGFQGFDAHAATPRPGLVLGITGAPGCGKSTLTAALIAEYRRRQPDRRIGVIAVDPSSPFSGGAVLGDRIRMMQHAADPNVFIRSLATRGRLGGLSAGARGVVEVMGWIGCDPVLIETTGVGQSEVEVARVADVILIVLAPGQGDSVQLLKAGLMEIGDLFAVNKADRPGAAELQRDLTAALRMEGKTAPVALVGAKDHRGIAELVDLIARGPDPSSLAVRNRAGALTNGTTESQS